MWVEAPVQGKENPSCETQVTIAKLDTLNFSNEQSMRIACLHVSLMILYNIVIISLLRMFIL